MIGLPYVDLDEKLSDIMSSYWVNFAAAGNPNGAGLPEWKAYNLQNEQVMELGECIKMISVPNKEMYEFLDEYENRKSTING